MIACNHTKTYWSELLPAELVAYTQRLLFQAKAWAWFNPHKGDVVVYRNTGGVPEEAFGSP